MIFVEDGKASLNVKAEEHDVAVGDYIVIVQARTSGLPAVR